MVRRGRDLASGWLGGTVGAHGGRGRPAANSIRPPAPERHRGPSLRVGGLGLRQKSTGVESAGAGVGGAQPLPSFLKRRQQRAKVAVDVSPDRLDRPKGQAAVDCR